MENETKAKNLKLIHHLPEKLPLISGDANALTYLFTNLISNAIKYNTQNGEVKIEAKQEGENLVVSVSDTGVGISQDDLKRLFDEFFRSKDEAAQKIAGTGLGLSIAKRIAEVHNGTIKIKSKLGEGSTFEVHLPILKIN